MKMGVNTLNNWVLKGGKVFSVIISVNRIANHSKEIGGKRDKESAIKA